MVLLGKELYLMKPTHTHIPGMKICLPLVIIGLITATPSLLLRLSGTRNHFIKGLFDRMQWDIFRRLCVKK